MCSITSGSTLWRRLLPGMLLGMAAQFAWAQPFPSKPIEFVVHSAPGGGPDQFARIVADILTREKAFAQPIIIANRTGGGGAVAFGHIKSKRGDPHFVLGMGTATVLTAAVRADLELGLEIYTPLALFGLDAQAVAVAADSKFTNVRELIEAGRREPNSLAAGIASATGTARLVLYLMERDANARFKYVSFKSGNDAALAVAGGHVTFTTENVSEAYPLVEAKKLRMLAVTSEKRLALAPDVPTLKEMGYPIVVNTGRGLAMPAGVPKEAAMAMEAALKRAHESAAWKDFATRNMYENTYMNGAEFAHFLASHREEMQRFLTAIGQTQK